MKGEGRLYITQCNVLCHYFNKRMMMTLKESKDSALNVIWDADVRHAAVREF